MTNAGVMTNIAAHLLNASLSEYVSKVDGLRLQRIATCGYNDELDDGIEVTFKSPSDGLTPDSVIKFIAVYEAGAAHDDDDNFVPGNVVVNAWIASVTGHVNTTEFMREAKFIQDVSVVVAAIMKMLNPT